VPSGLCDGALSPEVGWKAWVKALGWRFRKVISFSCYFVFGAWWLEYFAP
jgi:hypothetical protein